MDSVRIGRRYFHISGLASFKHSINEIDLAALEKKRNLSAIINIKRGYVRSSFENVSKTFKTKNIDTAVNSFISSLYNEKQNDTEWKSIQPFQTFDENNQRQRTRHTKLYLIQTKLHGDYATMREKRKNRCKQLQQRFAGLPKNYSMVKLSKLLNNEVFLKKDAFRYYQELGKLYLSSTYKPAAMYMRWTDLELLLTRIIFANRNLRTAGYLRQAKNLSLYAQQILEDCSLSGIKLTRMELFKLLRITSAISEKSKLFKLYRQFANAFEPSSDSELFMYFLNSYIPLGRNFKIVQEEDIQYGMAILSDMIKCASPIVPTRLMDYLILKLGACSGSTFLVLETVEHLLANYHLDLESMLAIIESLFKVDEADLSLIIMNRYLDECKDGQREANPLGLKFADFPNRYRIDVRLMDFMLKEHRSISDRVGFKYYLEYDERIWNSFMRYYGKATKQKYLTTQKVAMERKINQIKAGGR